MSPTVLQRAVSVFLLLERPKRAEHIHVKRDRTLAKFWLAPVRMAYNYGFSQTELNRIAAIVRKHEAALSKAWHEYFKRRDGNSGGQERSGH